MEYGSQIWNPFYNIYNEDIERVQRKFTRIVCYKFKIEYNSYASRLESLKMMTLSNRRLLADEMLLYKIVNRRLRTTLENDINVHIPTRQTRFTPTFYLPHTSTNIEFYSVSLRIQRQHNEIFGSINLFENTISRFKKNITQILINN